MKYFLLLVWLFCSVTITAEETPRMELMVLDLFTMETPQQCDSQSESFLMMAAAANIKINENDVTAWNPQTARWTLDPNKFTKYKFYKEVQDHCFYLSINGGIVANGAILSSHSARLSSSPTVRVFYTQNGIDLQLASGNSSDAQPIHMDKLNTALKK